MPPRAARRDHPVIAPHGVRNDEYYWLRDDARDDPEVLGYLRAENAYQAALLDPTREAQEVLFRELRDRVAPDDATVPVRRDGSWRYTRFESGKEHPIHCRRADRPGAAEEILLDVNRLAQEGGAPEDGGYCAVGALETAPDGRILAYSVDRRGRRQYVLHFRALDDGAPILETIPDVQDFAWAGDSRTVLYVEKDPVTLLGVRVKKHRLGEDPAGDELVYEERDPTFYLDIERSRSGRFLFLFLRSTVASEQWVAAADDPALAFRVLVPRRRDHEYRAEDHGDRWLLRTNHGARNFRLAAAPMEPPDAVADPGRWEDVLAGREDTLLEEFLVFRQFVAFGERGQGRRRIRVRRFADGGEQAIDFEDPGSVAFLDQNPEQDTAVLRLRYSSLVVPWTVVDVDLGTGERRRRKRDAVPGDFDPDRYETRLLFAPARDGARIPVSVAHRRDLRRGGAAALHVYGYGAYGVSSDPVFQSSRLSLLDRGLVVAIAHVRGGQEMGRAWYDDGRLLSKKNSFHDFIDATEFLLAEGYGSPGRVAAMGGSAGGLLMGAVINLRPDLYRVVTARVPFVDVVTTMLDESIPLTTNEFDEWGDPRRREHYQYMLSYSPYDQVAAHPYPALLVTTGLWDSQVQYFEPAKWVARLRARGQGQHPIALHVDFEAGHGGASGRFRRLRETALEYAFVFAQLGIPLAPLPPPAAASGQPPPGPAGLG